MFLIGLTGNIATGKSTVRAFLEERGARALDADSLAHAVILRGRPAWHAVLTAFGQDVLRSNGQIDRRKLARVVFGHPDKLRLLESIVHPALRVDLLALLREADDPVMVIEAVKLVEGGLSTLCDSVWVVTCDPAEAKRRLIEDRHLTEAEANARLASQPSTVAKLALADVVIDNSGTREETRLQVTRAWEKLSLQSSGDKAALLAQMLGLAPPADGRPGPVQAPAPRGADTPDAPQHPAGPSSAAPAPPAAINAPTTTAGDPMQEPPAAPPPQTVPAPSAPAPAAPAQVVQPPGQAVGAPEPEGPPSVRRARRGDVDTLSRVLASLEGRAEPLSRAETMSQFGRWGFWLAEAGGHTRALVSWQAENLVGIAREFWFERPEDASLMPNLLSSIEQEADALMCEVLLLMVRPEVAGLVSPVVGQQGYTRQDLEELHRIWRDIARPYVREGDVYWVRRLRDEMVTRPV